MWKSHLTYRGRACGCVEIPCDLYLTGCRLWVCGIHIGLTRVELVTVWQRGFKDIVEERVADGSGDKQLRRPQVVDRRRLSP